MKHTVTALKSGQPLEPHIYTPAHDYVRRSPARFSESCACIYCGRPFETYVDQPDTAERKRLDVQSYPFALPEKRRGQ